MSTTQTLSGGLSRGWEFQPRLKKPRARVQIALEQQTEINAYIHQKSLVRLCCCLGQESHQYPLLRQKKQFSKKQLLMRGTRGIAYRLESLDTATIAGICMMQIGFYGPKVVFPGRFTSFLDKSGTSSGGWTKRLDEVGNGLCGFLCSKRFF